MGGQVLETYADKYISEKVNKSIHKERLRFAKDLMLYDTDLSNEDISKLSSLSVEEIEELRKQ